MVNNNIEGALNLLKCIRCNSSDLVMKHDDIIDRSEHTTLFGEFYLSCRSCGNYYPITDDGIPIMWTPQIKEILKGEENKNSALYSNIYHYNRISNDYAVNFRRKGSNAKRIKKGAEIILNRSSKLEAYQTNEKYHLDIGCGPGHVLEWLGGIAIKKIGLDVSLTNLRNARKSTGANVVLGDATNIPFKDGVFSLVSEASALHHILDWKKVILESCRVCSKTNGGILFDSEPTSESLSFSLLARLVFKMRWPVYKLLSYFNPKKIHFRSIALAREYYKNAEIHNQPGRGFSAIEVEGLFNSAGFSAEIFLSPDEYLHKRQSISFQEADWQRLVLHLLSGHNPFLAKYGSFTTLALPNKNQKIPENGN